MEDDLFKKNLKNLIVSYLHAITYQATVTELPRQREAIFKQVKFYQKLIKWINLN